MIKGLLSQLLILVIIFQLSAPQVYAANDRGNSQDNQQDSYSQNIEAFADRLESGNLKNVDPSKFDIFKLANQYVELYQNNQLVRTLDLNDFRIQSTVVAYTDIRVLFRKQTRELIFEGVRGMHIDGTGGEVVARHFIPNFDLVAIARDSEILSLVDQTGRIHAIDMGYVAEQVFKNPIPVIQSIWEPTYELGTIQRAEAKYLTRGSRPYNESEIDQNTVILKNEYNKAVIKAGDLLVRYDTPLGQTKILGIFSRDVTYQKLRVAASYLIATAALIAPNEKVMTALSDLLKDMGSEEIKPEELKDSPDNLTKRFLEKLDKIQLDSLRSGYKRNTEYSLNRKDVLGEDWMKTFEEIKSNQLAQYKDKESELIKKIELLKRLLVTTPLVDRYESKLEDHRNDPTYTEDALQKNWQGFTGKAGSQDPTDKTLFNQLSKMTEKIFSMKVLATLLSAGGVAYVMLPFVHDHYEVVEQIKTLNWMYEHYLFPVLKDQAYRTTLVYSMISMIMLWPMAHVMSWVSQNILKFLNKTVGKSSTRAANFLRDLSRNWSGLGNWQRVTSFGMRIYAQTVYPLVRRTIEHGLNQPQFFSALQNGMNPFSKINADSEAGKKAGITKPEYVGINNPFLHGQKLEDKISVKERLQSHILNKQEQARHLAWILAVQLVSVKQGIDPATLVQVSSGQVDASKLNEIINNPKLKQEWYLISSEIYKQLKAYDLVSPDFENLDPKLVQEFYDIAQKAAEKIHSQSQLRKTTSELLVKAKRFHVWVFNNFPALGGGMREYQFLNSIYTSKYVTGQVYKEFVLDHISMAGIYSLYGSRADMSQPQDLAADPNGFLWTSKGNLYDMFYNTYIHFFVTGARASLVYQTVKAKEAEEYKPYEDFYYESKDRQQGFVRGYWDWMSTTFNPLKSDLGYYAWKSFSKRFATLQSGIVMTLFFQYLLLHRNPAEALMAFSISFFAAQWFFGWVWDPVQRGNQMEEQRFEAWMEELKQARYEISQGVKEENPEKSRLLIEGGYNKIIALYKKHNPSALDALERILKRENIADKKTIRTFTEKDQRFYGLIAELANAIETKDKPRTLSVQRKLNRFMSGEADLSETELNKLSARGLLEFSLSNAPIYTKPNEIITWMTTFGAAAGSTVLATPYSVRITNDAYITWENLAFWVGVSAIGYATTYLLLAKSPWEFYIKKARQLKGWIRGNPDSKIPEVLNEKTRPSADQALRCQFIFAK